MQNPHKILKDKPVYLEKPLFKAAMFAKVLIDDGMNPGLANYKAGQYYGYSASDIGWARNQLKQTATKYNKD
jgi:hypothetical protein